MARNPKKRTSIRKLVKKNGLKKKTGQKAFPAIQQGTGQSVQRAFGNSRGKSLQGVFTAYHPNHLPLPVATGSYTTVRITQLISTNDRVLAFGTFKGGLMVDSTTASDSNEYGWAPYCAVSCPDQTTTTSPAVGTRFWRMLGLKHLGGMATLVPSALSVQLMNPQSLQQTNGILYVGRMYTQLRGEDETTAWDSLANEFVSYQAPRLCSAGKLALRGVTVDAAPFNMTELQDFDRIVDPAPGTDPSYDTPWNSQTIGTDPQINRKWHMKGFSPIVVYNPAAVGVQFLVTMELRVRFDMGHPASSTHTMHSPVPHTVWGKAIADMVQAGHGVMDIAERVAQFGERMNGMMEFGARVGAMFT